jgi:uncharacterized phiE125 gp8 family phage protein
VSKSAHPFLIKNNMHNAVIDLIFVDSSGASNEPITLAQVKDWLKIDVTDEDTLLTTLITVARQLCENYTGVSFVQRKVIAIVNNSLGSIMLPYGPVAEVTEVQDENGEVLTTDYYTIEGVEFKRLKLPKDSYVRVEYNAGYTVLPQHFKTSLLTQVAYLYEHRGDEYAGQFSPMALQLLKPYRRVW